MIWKYGYKTTPTVLPGGLSPVETGQGQSTRTTGQHCSQSEPGQNRQAPGLSCQGPRASGTHRCRTVVASVGRGSLSPYSRVGEACGPGLERRRGGLHRARCLPGLGPPWELGRRGFALGRRDVAPFQARELPALLDQLQELRKGHRGLG